MTANHTKNITPSQDNALSGDDVVVPFQVEGLDIRGRTVQLGAAIDQILQRHDYPEVVSRLLAEATALTVLLGTALKFEGKFIFQTQSDGPVELLVVDFRAPQSIRAYARFDEERLAAAIAANQVKPEELLGRGTLALTVDQGEHTQRYQGIVALDGSTLEDVAREYFLQSEQIPTEVRLAVAKLFVRGEDGKTVEQWRAGGLMVQFLPHSELQLRQRDLPGGDVPGSDVLQGQAENADNHDPELTREEQLEDEWQEARSLVSTIDSSELTDPLVPSERLLYRLFHERGARVFEGIKVIDDCSCSREKIYDVLRGFSAEEITDSIEDGKISVTCEFCSTRYDFEPKELLN